MASNRIDFFLPAYPEKVSFYVSDAYEIGKMSTTKKKAKCHSRVEKNFFGVGRKKEKSRDTAVKHDDVWIDVCLMLMRRIDRPLRS